MGQVWTGAAAYESYVGRWSRLVAREFLAWLRVPRDASWLDVGCGTGALAQTILDICWPGAVAGVDPSPELVEHARRLASGARLQVADAQALPFADGTVDCAVAGLVLNFVADPARAVTEMARVVRRGGMVAAYVWDYADGMQLIRRFWDAAVELDPAADELHEAARFPLCRPQPLTELFRRAGLHEIQVRAVDVEARFADFDDLWRPFLEGSAPAQAYCASLSEEGRAALRERLREKVSCERDGSIRLELRAWGIKGRR
jgi:SAM-dependent methyltransferase